MGQEFGISVSRNLSINAILSATGGSVSLYMLPLLFAGGLKFGSYGYFCISFSSSFHLYVWLLVFFFFPSRKESVNIHMGFLVCSSCFASFHSWHYILMSKFHIASSC